MSSYLQPHRIFLTVEATSKKELLAELADAACRELSFLDKPQLLAALTEREKIGSTGIGDGIALPHAKLKELEELTVFFARSNRGIAYDSHDNRVVHLIFLLLAPLDMAGPYLNCLAGLSRALKQPAIRSILMRAQSPEEVLRVLAGAGV